MTAEARKAAHREWLEALLGRGDDTALERWLSPGHVLHQSLGELAPGPRGLRLGLRRLAAMFDSWLVRVTDQVATAERVMTRFEAHARHVGPIGPMRPTGRWVGFSALLSSRFGGDLAYESWLEVSALEALMALGAVAVPPELELPEE